MLWSRLQLTLILFFLIVITPVLACQYVFNVSVNVPMQKLYIRGLEVGDGLIFDSFEKEEGGYDSFKVHNPLSYDMEAQISYTQIELDSDNKIYTYDNTVTINISGNSYVKLQTQYAFTGSRQSHIDNESITYKITRPAEFTPKTVIKTMNETLCKQCLGADCLDDGMKCNLDNQCGSTICNIAKFCGHEKIVDCNTYIARSRMCNNNSCKTPDSQVAGEPYICDWECTSNTKPCNGFCRVPSSKEVGQPYSCSWECKSDRFDGSKCLKSTQQIAIDNRNMIFSIFIGVVIVAILLWYFALYKRKQEEKKARDTREEIEQLQKNKKNLAQTISMLKVQHEAGKKKIYDLKKDEANAEGIAKEIIMSRLKVEEEKQKKRFDQLSKDIKDIEAKEKLLNNLINERDNLRIREMAEYYQQPIDNLKIVTEGGGRYIKFKRNKYNSSEEGMLFHRWVYMKILHDKIPPDMHIHHIDTDKLNDYEWNLIALSKNIHDNISHIHLKKNDWLQCLNYLLENGYVKESDLHEYIKEHRKEIKSQK